MPNDIRSEYKCKNCETISGGPSCWQRARRARKKEEEIQATLAADLASPILVAGEDDQGNDVHPPLTFEERNEYLKESNKSHDTDYGVEDDDGEGVGGDESVDHKDDHYDDGADISWESTAYFSSQGVSEASGAAASSSPSPAVSGPTPWESE